MKIPTQKTIFVLIICLACISAVWIFKKQTEKIAQKKATVSVEEKIKNTDQIDSDGDNLEDWLETLLGTDPNNKDTDGDGTEDGQEIADGRDPRIKGPNDQNPYIMTSLLASNKTGTTTKESQTLTDEISKDFLSRYLLLKQSGGQINSDQAEQIAQLSLDKPDNQIKGDIYTANNLNINRNTDKTTISVYEKNFKDSVSRNFVGKVGRELIILEDSLNLNDEEEIKKIDPIIAYYENFIKEMLEMPVPVDAVSIHLENLNNASLMLEHIKAIREIYQDPIKAYIATSTYGDVFENIIISVQKLDKYFESKK